MVPAPGFTHMHTDLQQAIAFHDSIVAEGGKALVLGGDGVVGGNGPL